MDFRSLERNHRPISLSRPQQDIPQVTKTPAPQDNGLLSLIPFYDIGQKLFSGHGGDITPGEVGLEAALTFLPFGKLAKGASMLAKGAAKAGAKTAETAAVKGTSQAIMGAGSRLRGFGRDIRPGTVLPGSKKALDAAGATRINQAVDTASTGIIPRTARGQLKGVQDDLATKGAGLETATRAVNRPIDATAGDTIGRLVAEGRDRIVGFDPTNKAHIRLNNNYANRVAKAKDITELEAVRKDFDAEAKRLLKNPDTKGALSANLAKAYREGIDKYVAEAAPSLKAAKGEYRTLKQAEDLLSRPSVTNPSVKTPLLGGPLPFAGAAKQIGAEAGGKVLQAVGGASPLARIGRNLAGQAGRRAVVDPLVAGPQPSPTTLEGALAQPTDMPPGLDQYGMDGMAQPQDENPYPRENLLADMQRDPANADEYLKQYQMYQELFSTPQKPVNSTVAGNLTDMQKGLTTLDDLESMVGSRYAGGVVQGNLRQFNPFDTDFKTQQAMVDASRQIIGKAMEGGVLRKEDEEKYKRILPTMQDDPAVALAKLRYVRGVLTQALGNYQGLTGAGTQPSNLEEALSGTY